MKNISIKDLINNKKIGLYRVGYEHETLLRESLKEANENGLLDSKNLSYSLTYHDEYIAFVLYNSIQNIIIE